MSNGSFDLSKYFRAGSAVMQRSNQFEQSGTLTDDTPLITSNEFKEKIEGLERRLDKSDRKANINLILGLIVGAVITIMVSLIL